MRSFFFTALLLFSSAVSADCRFEDWILKDFTRTAGALGGCTYPLYHNNGVIAYAPDTGNWYHANGNVAYWTASGNWYYADGRAAFWAQTGNWYHQNGEAAYWAQTGNWFHPNRQPAYWAQNGFWYHYNNVIAYNAVTRNWFYPNGNFAGSSEKAVPYQAVEFLINQNCQFSTSILCYVARFH